MKKIFYTLILSVSILFANAQTTFLAEHFDYPSNDSLQNNGWFAHSAGTTNPILVTDIGLSWTQTPYLGSGIGHAAAPKNNGSDENTPLRGGFPDKGDVYTSFLLKTGVVATANQGVFFHIGQYTNVTNPTYTSINTGFRARTFVMPGANADKFKLGLSFNSGTIPTNVGVDATQDLDTGVTYLVVVKYSFVDGAMNDSVSMYVFKDGDDISMEPASPALGPLGGTQADMPLMQYVALRQYSTNPNLVIDGIIVKDAWDLLAPELNLTGPSLLTPANNTILTVEGNPRNEVIISWTAIKDAPEAPEYYWDLTLRDAPNFDEPEISVISDNDGSDTTLTLTIGDINGLLQYFDVAVNDTLHALWRVYTFVGDAEIESVNTFSISLVRGAVISDIADFNLLTPIDNARIVVDGSLNQNIVVSWESTTSNGDPVTYLFKTDTIGGGSFSDPFLTSPSDNLGQDTKLTLSYAQVDGLLASYGLQPGDSISFIWTIFAYSDVDVKEANEPFTLTLIRAKKTSTGAFSSKQLKMYPNPARDLVVINVENGVSSSSKINVFNHLGQAVDLTNAIQYSSSNIKLDVSHLTNGVYTIQIINGENITSEKFVIQK